MAKADNNKESGAEKAPVLTENKGSQVIGSGENEAVDELVSDLRGRIKDLESYVPSLTKEIETQKVTINNQVEKIAELEGIVAKQKETIANKDAVIAEDNKLIEAQKEEIVQLLKDQVELNKLIPDGITDNHGLQILDNEDLVVIRFLLSPAGRFKLPYNVGQEVALHKEVAAEIVESAYAEYVVEVE